MSKKLIYNLENPQGTLVNLTSEEIAQKEKDVIKRTQEKLIFQQEKQDAINKKISGKQKLLDLGLTEAEVKALIGV
jgi:hypothetical protein